MRRWSIGAAMALYLGITGVAHAAAAPTQLTVGDMARPLNVEGTPRFGWMPSSSKGNDVQTAYEIKVTKPDGGVVWDRSKVASPAQSYVAYAGPALANGEAYRWTVRTWDRDGEASDWAPDATFETGLTDSGWSGANWIRRPTNGNDFTDDWTLARKSFPALSSSPVTRARVYASAMGQYDIHVNGKTVGRGDNWDYPTEGQYYAFDATDAVQAGQPLSLGALYHYWTCTCQGRANGPTSNGTLSAAQAAGATNIKVNTATIFGVGDQITVGTGATAETATVTAVGTSGATGTGVTLAAPLTQAHASGVAVYDHQGPSGLLMKAVVDHADGTREAFVTDGTWKVHKADQFTNSTITRRNGDSGDNAERYDARAEIAGWDTASFDDASWAPAYAISPPPQPVNPNRDPFSHLDPAISQLDYQTVKPVSVKTLADGSVIADFGKVISAVPQLQFESGVAGTQGVVQTSYRLNNTTLSAAAAAGDTVLKVASVS